MSPRVASALARPSFSRFFAEFTITVMHHAAIVTRPCPHGQRQGVFDEAAFRTGFRRREKPVGNDDAPATHRSLVPQLAADFVPSAIQYGPGKSVVFAHA